MSGEGEFTDIPLALELQAMAQFLAKEIAKAPVEVQPVLVAAAIGLIEGTAGAAEAFVDALPSITPEDFHEEEKSAWRLTIEIDDEQTLDPATASAAVKFIEMMQKQTNPRTGPEPLIPHSTADELIEEQKKAMVPYFLEQVAKDE